MSFSNLNYKKVLTIIGFVVFVAAMSYALYYVFFRKQPPVVTPPQEQAGKGALQPAKPGAGVNEIINEPKPPVEVASEPKPVIKIPAVQVTQADQIAQGGITKVTDLDYNSNFNATLAADGKSVISYQKDTGKFYQIDNNGNKTTLGDKEFTDVQNITWSPTKHQAVLEFPDGANIVYNFKTGEQVTLPQNWTEFDFSGDGELLAFKDLDPNPDYRWLAVAKPDGTQARYLEHMGRNDWEVDVNFSPDSRVIALYNTSKDSTTTKTYLIGQNKENYKVLYTRGHDVRSQWSPNSNQLLYSAYSAETNYLPQLYITDAAGENIGENHRVISLNTWADKCTFASNTVIYCAVPRDLQYGAGFAPEKADQLPDDIYMVNLENGFKTKIAEPEYSYTIDQLFVSDDDSTLYFTEKSTGSLHGIQLK